MIGLNGSGKSSLLKIIAGLDKSYQGEVVFSPGYSVGYLAQEPELDPNKTVREIVEEGAAETIAVLKEYEEINEKFGLPEVYENPDEMDKRPGSHPGQRLAGLSPDIQCLHKKYPGREITERTQTSGNKAGCCHAEGEPDDCGCSI